MDHQQRLQDVKNSWRIQIDVEKERFRTTVERKDVEIELVAEHLKDGHIEMFTIHQLLSYYNQNTSSNAARHSFQRQLRSFNRFQKLVDDGLEEIYPALSKTNLRLKLPTKLIEASPALQKFSEAVQNLWNDCPEKLPFELLVLQRKFSRKCHLIQTTLNQILTEHEVYQKKSGSSWKRFIESKRAIMEIQNILKIHYENLKITMEELKELMEEFNNETISENFNMLSLIYQGSNSLTDDGSSVSEHL